ncbi:MAG: PAS domain S-box protein, partial [Paracoccus sp. (in: a-proteobacteria)]|nr:PAS domain S-box protein [Paracoccus sp. (in: a-proteobacteria)]
MTHPTIHPHPDQALHALESVQKVLSYSMDGLITDVNQRYLDVAGYQRSEMVGKPLSAFLPPGQSGASESFWQGLRRGEPQTGQFMRIGKSGAPYWFEGIYTPVRGRDGALEGVVLFGIDITEAKLRSAEAIDLSKALSRSQAMIEFTPEGEIVGANENFLRVMGYTLAEIKGRHHSMFLDSETVRSPEYAKFWEDLRAGQFRAGEFKRLTKGGIPAYIVASYNPVTGADGKVSRVVKYATDVTATRIAVQELTNGLARMAEGDLTVRLTEAVRGEFETVRNSFNNSLESFADMVNQVRTRAETIEVEAEAIAGGAEDMANRGEN